LTAVDQLGILFTLVVLESVLSFDNAAILAAMSRRLPLGEGRRRALNYGLAIAFALRVVAVLGVIILLRYEWLLTVGGLYLVALWLKHTWGLLAGREGTPGAPRMAKPIKGRLGLSAFSLTILQIGVVNLAFSLDQIVVTVGFTRQRLLIIGAALIGILALRLVAPYLSRLMDWLPILEDMAYIAVGFVGCLLVLEYPIGFRSPHAGLAWIAPFKVPITLGLFVVPVLLKLLFDVPKSHGPHHATVEESIREAAQPTPTVEALRVAIAESQPAHVTEIQQKGKPTRAHVDHLSEAPAQGPAGAKPPAKPRKRGKARPGAKR
jgi:YkoY family integral membrane protein